MMDGQEARRVDPLFPLAPAGSNIPAQHRKAGLERSRAGAVRLYQAGEMRLGGKLRAECWETIGERTRERLREHAGGVIEWFAGQDPSSPGGRSYAGVFGDRGLGIAEPRINTDHRP